MPSPETNSKLTLSDVYSFIMDTGLIPSDKHRSHGECHAPSGSKLSGAAAPESRTFHKIFAMNSTTDQEKV